MRTLRWAADQGRVGREKKGRNRKMHEAVTAALPNAGKYIPDYTTSHLRR
jgi:hypothetical protein